jgi:hypothetical protein
MNCTVILGRAEPSFHFPDDRIARVVKVYRMYCFTYATAVLSRLLRQSTRSRDLLPLRHIFRQNKYITLASFLSQDGETPLVLKTNVRDRIDEEAGHLR